MLFIGVQSGLWSPQQSQRHWVSRRGRALAVGLLVGTHASEELAGPSTAGAGAPACTTGASVTESESGLAPRGVLRRSRPGAQQLGHRPPAGSRGVLGAEPLRHLQMGETLGRPGCRTPRGEGTGPWCASSGHFPVSPLVSARKV